MAGRISASTSSDSLSNEYSIRLTISSRLEFNIVSRGNLLFNPSPAKIVRIASHTAMTLPRSLKWVAGIFLTLIVLIILVIAFFDWNWLRDPIARKVSSSTGRSFVINGDLNVHLSMQPRIVANDIVLGNPAWSREPSMARIKRLDFRIDILKLLAGSVAFPQMALSEPHTQLGLQ